MGALAFVLNGGILALAAIAAEASERPPPSPSAAPALPCQCRALGRLWEMGEEVCMDLGSGRRAYLCGMHQNVTHWQATGRRCPET